MLISCTDCVTGLLNRWSLLLLQTPELLDDRGIYFLSPLEKLSCFRLTSWWRFTFFYYRIIFPQSLNLYYFISGMIQRFSLQLLLCYVGLAPSSKGFIFSPVPATLHPSACVFEGRQHQAIFTYNSIFQKTSETFKRCVCLGKKTTTVPMAV